MTTCQICGADSVSKSLDIGAHPVTSRLLERPDEELETFDLSLGICATCGTLQLMKPVPYSALVPPIAGLMSREPEVHLDDVFERALKLPGITPESVIAGVSYKDDTTLERFRKRGYENIWRVDMRDDLDVTDPYANIETVQVNLTPERLSKVAARRGQADLLIVRHIYEHAEDLAAFTAGIGELVKPGGYLMVEVPDNTANLDRRDYTMIWEEHAIYFVPETFRQALALAGYRPVIDESYPFPFENSLVLIMQRTNERPAPSAEGLDDVRRRVDRYAADFAPTTALLQNYISERRNAGETFALFGAGHLTCSFVNYHGLGGMFEFVADDTPEKQGRFLPGSGLPIVLSERLAADGISHCLLGLAPENEHKVIGRNQAWADGGGTFRSIFVASERSLISELRGRD